MSLTMFFVFGIAVSLAVSGFMVLAGIGDVPDNRSNHKVIIPTGGGLGILAALGLMSLLISHNGVLSPEFSQILALIWAVGFLGLMDDIYTLPAILKLFVLAVLSAGAVWVTGPVTILPAGQLAMSIPLVLAVIGSFLWVFVVTNIVNFMDGSNGLMLVVMGVASSCLAGVAAVLGADQTPILLVMLTAGAIGLMPYNFRSRARIFAGDVGSLTIGFTYAVAALWLCREADGALPVYIAPVLILPFLADSLLTMLLRLKRGENLMEPHRQHLYQRLIGHGYSHMAVAFLYGLAGLFLALGSLWIVPQNGHQYISFILIPSAMLLVVYILAGRRFN